MRRAKIVCTLGPATDSPAAVKKLVLKGMDVARLNCSHASHKDLAHLVEIIRTTSDECSRPIAILLDLQGPKIRIGTFPKGPVQIKSGDKITITTKEPKEGNSAKLISTSYEELPEEVEPGDRILIDDGNIELRVLSSADDKIKCEVVYGGMLSDHKGMNLPGIKLSIPSLTEKDTADLLFGLECGVDYVALSFVRHPADIRTVQQIIRSQNFTTPVIAKIEKPEALDCIDDIIAVADGVMVARGDMAVETSPEKVPSAQKLIIQKCNAAGIPVILATQMMESMVENARPTRAEASDVANGIFDGADALMLSAETASGKYPFEVVQIMTDIIGQAERDRSKLGIQESDTPPVISIADAVEHAASLIALESGARAICCITNSGKGAHALSKYRPKVPIFALTDQKEALQRLALIWGVKGILVPEIKSSVNVFTFVESKVVEWWNATLTHVFRPLEKGDLLVITVGLPTDSRTKTNAVKVCSIQHTDP